MLIDIGANLTHDSFDDDRDQVLTRASEQGIAQLIITGASVLGSQQALDLANRYENLFATVGIHPHHAEETNDESLTLLTELAQNNKVKAIGETGLDFFRDFSARDTQLKSFEQHIELASKTNLPLFLHERDAYPTFHGVLAPKRAQLGNIVVHCFTGEKDALDSYLDMDCYIGITGWICDERRGAHLAELIQYIPADRLMIETDAPYLLPRTIRPKPKSRRNEPANLTYVCEHVAAILKLPYEQIAQQTTENARQFFSLPEVEEPPA